MFTIPVMKAFPLSPPKTVEILEMNHVKTNFSLFRHPRGKPYSICSSIPPSPTESRGRFPEAYSTTSTTIGARTGEGATDHYYSTRWLQPRAALPTQSIFSVSSMGATVKSDAWASRGSIVILDRLVPAWAMTSLLLAGSTRTDPTSSRGAGCRPSRRCPQYRQLIPLMRITCTVCGGRIVTRSI